MTCDELLRIIAQDKKALHSLLGENYQQSAFENRYILNPRRLGELGKEDVERFEEYLRLQDSRIGLDFGRHRAEEGLSQRPLLSVGKILRDFFVARLAAVDPQLLQTAFLCVDAFMTAYLDGYIRAREEQILKDQEQLRVALSTALDRQRQELHIKNHAIHTSVNGIILSGLDGRITYVNPALLNMWGYEKEELLTGRSILGFWGADSRSVVKILQERGGWHGEIAVQRADGASFEVAISASLIRDEKGNPVGFISFFYDVTERKRLESQFRQAQKMEALGQLAGGIVHDFNNLLTAISGYAQLALMELPESSKHYQDFLQIKTATDRGKELTQELRIFTRQAASSREPVDLNSIVEETQKILSRTFPPEIRTSLELDPKLREIKGHPSQMSQMVMNLCVNARDAIIGGLREQERSGAASRRQGTLTLKTYNLELDAAVASRYLNARPGTYICLNVRDNGIGIPAANLDRLFEPFFTTKGEKSGTGLGLAVVYGIVQNHGGFIDVHSREREGSSFSVFLPALPQKGKEPQPSSGAIDLAAGKGTILVAEDDPQVQEMIGETLTKSGYTILAAANGAEALELYRRSSREISLVILDMVMPQMGGKECFYRLRGLNPEAKILIITGFTVDGSAEDFLKEGASAVMTKPFDLHDFTSTIQRIISP